MIKLKLIKLLRTPAAKALGNMIIVAAGEAIIRYTKATIKVMQRRAKERNTKNYQESELTNVAETNQVG